MKHRAFARGRRVAAGGFFLLIVWTLVACQTVHHGRTDPRLWEVPESITTAVRDEPRENLAQLISYIQEQSSNEREAFRYAHDWVAKNVVYDYAVYEGTAEGGREPYEVIAHGKAVCEGYARTLKLLCDELDIECRYIVGYVRGVDDPGTEAALQSPEDADRSRHAWNAVRLDNTWYLVDVTWNAAWFLDDDGLTLNYSHNYFQPPPEHFIHTHFPDETRWQLLDEPITFAEFKTLPALTPAFFRYGLRPIETYASAITPVGNTYSLQFAVPEGVRLTGVLADPSAADDAEYRHYDLVTLSPSGVQTVDIRFPGPGNYAFNLWAKYETDDGRYDHAATYHFDVPETAEGARPYLTTYSRFREHRIRDLEPADRVLERGTVQSFSFSTDVNRRYYLYAPDHEKHRFSRNRETGRYEAVALLESDSVYLAVRRGDRYRYLAKFLVE